MTRLSECSDLGSTVCVVQAAGWYADPTGRHEWRYWRPGWSDLSADGTEEVTDPLRPRWRRYVGLALLAQLVFVPVIGFVLVDRSDKLDSRVGVVQAADQVPPEASIVYAPCPGERIQHIALSESTGKGSLSEVIWSATGDASADQQITFGQTPAGMQTKQRLVHPVGARQSLVLLVSTNQLTSPAVLNFNMADVPSSGALSYRGTYLNSDAFRTAAFDSTACGAEHDSTRALLTKVVVAEVVLAVVGVALLMLPRYPGPASRYA